MRVVDNVFSYVVYAGMAGSVDFDYIYSTTIGNFLAAFAGVAGFCLGIFFFGTVHCFGNQSGCGCFPYTTRATKKIGVGNVVIFYLVGNGLGYMGLSGNIGKVLGTVSVIEGHIVRV